jgi:hypothetical protein
MSKSLIFTIANKYCLKNRKEFKNSWLFNPTIWNKLLWKYLPDKKENDYIGLVAKGKDPYVNLNKEIYIKKDIIDMIMWKLSVAAIFSSKDKKIIIESITEYKKRENIIGEEAERFDEITNFINCIDDEYFVIQGTDCVDTVENWFKDGMDLADWKEYKCEFIVIEENSIKAIPNIQYFANKPKKNSDYKININDIPKFTTTSSAYRVDSSLRYILELLEEYKEEGLDLEPDFQRNYVWTEEQQVKFIEYLIKGGTVNPIYFNKNEESFVIIDGKQRLKAIERFLKKEISIFSGIYFDEIEPKNYLFQIKLHIRINHLETKNEYLNWYLELNSGGTVHTEEELDKVRKMIEL